MLKTIIVDDESGSRKVLRRYLTDYCPDVEIVAEAGDVAATVDLIRDNNPDLVFLDIEMPGGNGFELLTHFPNPQFQIIFVTAYQEYALRAFQISAMGYILKPVRIKILKEAVAKAKKHFDAERFREQLDVMQEALKKKDSASKLVISTNEGMHFISLEEVLYMEADGAYTIFHLTNGKEFVASKRIGEFEENIKNPKIFKPHRSYLVNLEFITRYTKSDGGRIFMENGAEIPVARSKRQEFLKFIGNGLAGK